MAFIENLGTVLIISVIIIASILIILITVEKKLKKKKIKNQNKNQFYITEIKQIKKSDPENALKSIDEIARRFFEEAFKIKKFIGYLELKRLFKQKNNVKVMEFCEIMNMLLYSKEKKNMLLYSKEKKDQIQKLINLLIEIIDTNKIISKEEQIKTKKSNYRFGLRKMNIFRISKKKLENKEDNREKD